MAAYLENCRELGKLDYFPPSRARKKSDKKVCKKIDVSMLQR